MMIKVVFASIVVLSSYIGFSQTTQKASVETSVFGIQTGLLGVWVHNELKLSNLVALRSEIGYAGLNSSNIRPVLALEPRWYYNLKKRADSNKDIAGNSGNYLSLRTRYHFHSNSDAETSTLYHVLVVTSYGIRRNLGDHFNYEAGFGGGFGFRKGSNREINLIPYVSFSIGYRF